MMLWYNLLKLKSLNRDGAWLLYSWLETLYAIHLYRVIETCYNVSCIVPEKLINRNKVYKTKGTQNSKAYCLWVYSGLMGDTLSLIAGLMIHREPVWSTAVSHWPWHVRSSVRSLWPFWQLHSKEPTVFRQKWSQPPLFSWHSSMSEWRRWKSEKQKVRQLTRKFVSDIDLKLGCLPPESQYNCSMMFKSEPCDHKWYT